jgi:hypothetical protein
MYVCILYTQIVSYERVKKPNFPGCMLAKFYKSPHVPYIVDSGANYKTYTNKLVVTARNNNLHESRESELRLSSTDYKMHNTKKRKTLHHK